MRFFILFCLWVPFISYGGDGKILLLEERTPQVRRAIIDALKTAGEVFTLSNLSIIDTLSMEGLYIKSLKPGDFSGLTSLKILNLKDNQLSELPEGVFSGLSSLREIDLEDNKLIELPEGVFSELSALKTLNLKGNELSESSKKAVHQTTVKDCKILFD